MEPYTDPSNLVAEARVKLQSLTGRLEACLQRLESLAKEEDASKPIQLDVQRTDQNLLASARQFSLTQQLMAVDGPFDDDLRISRSISANQEYTTYVQCCDETDATATCSLTNSMSGRHKQCQSAPCGKGAHCNQAMLSGTSPIRHLPQPTTSTLSSSKSLQTSPGTSQTAALNYHAAESVDCTELADELCQLLLGGPMQPVNERYGSNNAVTQPGQSNKINHAHDGSLLTDAPLMYHPLMLQRDVPAPVQAAQNSSVPSSRETSNGGTGVKTPLSRLAERRAEERINRALQSLSSRKQSRETAVSPSPLDTKSLSSRKPSHNGSVLTGLLSPQDATPIPGLQPTQSPHVRRQRRRSVELVEIKRSVGSSYNYDHELMGSAGSNSYVEHQALEASTLQEPTAPYTHSEANNKPADVLHGGDIQSHGWQQPNSQPTSLPCTPHLPGGRLKDTLQACRLVAAARRLQLHDNRPGITVDVQELMTLLATDSQLAPALTDLLDKIQQQAILRCCLLGWRSCIANKQSAS